MYLKTSETKIQYKNKAFCQIPMAQSKGIVGNMQDMNRCVVIFVPWRNFNGQND